MSICKLHRLALLPMVALVFLTSCVTPEPRPEGVSRGVAFSVTPLYPNSFEIVASSSRVRDAQELKEAWQKKAVMVANGRRFKITSPPTAHAGESYVSPYGTPVLIRRVEGTITLLDGQAGGAPSR